MSRSLWSEVKAFSELTNRLRSKSAETKPAVTLVISMCFRYLITKIRYRGNFWLPTLGLKMSVMDLMWLRLIQLLHIFLHLFMFLRCTMWLDIVQTMQYSTDSEIHPFSDVVQLVARQAKSNLGVSWAVSQCLLAWRTLFCLKNV